MSDDAIASEELAQRLSDSDLLTRRVNQAIRTAVLGHRDAGNPVATYRDGKVVWIAPEAIDLPERYTPGDATALPTG